MIKCSSKLLLVTTVFSVQWSFGVTCWEIFSTAKTPYPGIHPTSLIAQLENGERLPMPNNAACCDSMYVIILGVCTKDTQVWYVYLFIGLQVQNELAENSFVAPTIIVHFLYRYLVLAQQIWNWSTFDFSVGSPIIRWHKLNMLYT